MVREVATAFGESFDNVPRSKRQIGLASAVFLIFNRIIGTGVYASPSIILRASGSIGVTFVMWILGAFIAAAGTAVYVELGTGLPRSGGDKTYLEFIYSRPKYLVTCVYAMYGLFLGAIAAASVVFGEYFLRSLSITPTQFNVRFCAVLCMTFCFFIHGTYLKWGLRLQNALGFFNLFVLSLIAVCGMLSLAGVSGFTVRDGYDIPHNYEWDSFWEGSVTDTNAFVMGMYNVTWSFIGYSNANYALSEVRNPVRTIKRAAPLALALVALAYIFVNIAYFAVISKVDILDSGTVAAALFFRNLFGPAASKALSAIIALTTLGNVLSVLFSQGRVNQELGREGVIPYSSFISSNKPFDTPLAGLFVQWAVSVITVIATPSGDAYLFMVNLNTFPLMIINVLVSGGLLLLYTRAYKSFNWQPPFQASRSVVVFFFLSQLFFAVVPFIPPSPGFDIYENLPYWSHVAVSIVIASLGAVYWFNVFIWLPRRKGYKLEREMVVQEDEISRGVFTKVPIEQGSVIRGFAS
ncbi:hypothetical protein SERLA73DRAFT_119094 [Serpula lacrymans var. lacrymans S7.3]|uniref:Amino acid transporter n=2 Tax=Serpula lacrymans var. lacrymans TaxID=341189 RepID=F8PKL2_SERL3|nr:uncharacterized protein SERLADRAFT_365145 [Serpula lacrymans var. lacrymans S7.9]EGO03346.1 hypothetical protein SERLA73DRAFT_119094 [Serpula lacrymans var. lacrymans S7.3]EGO29119.1 hypothetical protein SERLADRAFT_365145 [Serpula lacrymans var. lacrymans S7.9]